MNGELIVTYEGFEKYGISRKAIKTAIDIARAPAILDAAQRDALLQKDAPLGWN